ERRLGLAGSTGRRLLLRGKHGQLVAPVHAGRDGQDEAVLADRAGFGLGGEPPGGALIALANALLPEDMDALLLLAPPAIGDRHETHRLPEPVRRQVLRAPAAVETASVSAAVELRLEQRRADQLALRAGHN